MKISNSNFFPITKFFWDSVIFSSLWTVHRKFEKIEVPGRKIKVAENLTGIISIYLTLNLGENNFFQFLTRHLEFFLFLVRAPDSINGDISAAAAAGGAAILDGEIFEMTQSTEVYHS